MSNAASFDGASDPWIVPLFPLPNIVLLPRAVLPLHIFEERYKEMTHDALAGERQIAMALLRPGWEACYYAKPPIESVVCVGNILSHEQLPDGRYNFLLQGTARARILRECAVGGHPYRVAVLEPLAEKHPGESALVALRERLRAPFCDGPLASGGAGEQFRLLFQSALKTSDLADVIAFNFLDDLALKQSLLGEADVGRRITRVAEALDALCLAAPLKPLAFFGRPSMN